MVIMHEEVSLPSQSEHSEHFSQIVGSLIEVAFVFIFESQHFPIVFLHRKLFAGIVAWVLLSSCCLLACRDGSEIFGCFALGLLQCCSLGATHFYYLLMLNYGNIIHLQRLNMKRNQERQRQFSATRLSYSRNNSFKDSQPSVSPSRISNPQQAQSKASISQQRHRALTLMCNNCFNKQVSTQKTHKNGSSNDPNSGQEWGLFKTDKNKNNIQNLQNQVKKVTQYNLHKIKENQKQKEQLKNQKQTMLTDSYYFGEKSQSTAQITQNKRLELKRELEMQIAVARERRERQKRQIRDASPNFIIETGYSRNKRQMQGEQYKMTLLEQMNNNKYKKMRDEQLQKKENNNYDLPFVKDAEQKMQTYLKLKNATKQNIREQFKKKKEQEQSLRQKYQRERQAEQQSRLENEKHARQENQKTEQMRRTIINRYLQDLRKQMQENQVRRQKQFEKISNEPTCTLIPQQNHNTGFGEACGCCSKEFPKNFLSPYLKPNQVAHD